MGQPSSWNASRTGTKGVGFPLSYTTCQYFGGRRGQVIALVAQVVVAAVQCQAALVDAVHADILTSHAAQAATVEHRASGITVLQAADLCVDFAKSRTFSARRRTGRTGVRPVCLSTHPATGERQSSEPEVPETSWVQVIFCVDFAKSRTFSARRRTGRTGVRPVCLSTHPATGERQSSEPEVPETSWVRSAA